MEARAIARHQVVAPRKARLVVDLIRGKSIVDARAICKFSDRAAAEIVEKVLNSAVANAANLHNLKAEDPYIAEAFVDQAPTLKRIQPRAMGRAFRIRKRRSHITVIVKTRKEA